MKHTIVTIMEAIGRGIQAVAHAVAGVVMGSMQAHISIAALKNQAFGVLQAMAAVALAPVILFRTIAYALQFQAAVIMNVNREFALPVAEVLQVAFVTVREVLLADVTHTAPITVVPIPPTKTPAFPPSLPHVPPTTPTTTITSSQVQAGHKDMQHQTQETAPHIVYTMIRER